MNDLSQLIQGSEEWLQARCGSLGASQIHLALAKIKSGWGASRDNIMADLICERLTGEPTETYQSADMLLGQQREPLAREAYCWLRGVDVELVGIVLHPQIKGTHASPDALVPPDGLLEIKCPKRATHLATLCGAPVDRPLFAARLLADGMHRQEMGRHRVVQPGFPARDAAACAAHGARR